MNFLSKLVAATVVVAGLGSVSFAGQSPVRFKIPFTFEAGGAVLPAGEYQITENAQNVLRFTALDAKKQALILDNNAPVTHRFEGSPQILFRQYGDRYFLYQVFEGGATTRVRQYPVTKSEKAAKAAMEGSEPETVVIGAK